jgi:mono/diheme cytochrome c family protein
MSVIRKAGLFRWLPVAVTALALLAMLPGGRAVAAGEDAPTLAPAPPPSFDLKDQARIRAGKRRFAANCAGYCHGSDGTAGRGPSFRNQPNFDPQVAFAAIRDGRKGSDVMPPWGNAFSSDEIWELVAFLGNLAEQKD